MAEYRAALIGCGRIGSELADDPLMAGDVFTHAEAYVRCPRTELIAVCDTDPERARRCATRWGVGDYYSDLSTLLDEQRPEIVSVCTPTASHYDAVRRILTQGTSVRAILCEKPLATSIVHAEELIRLARARDVVLAVVYMRRYADNFGTLRRLIAEGGLGAIQGVAGWYPFGTLHSGSHWFDMLRMLVGEVEWVSAFDILGEGGEDPTLDLVLGLENGRLATLRATEISRFALFEMDIVGTAGRARVLQNGFEMELSLPGPSKRTEGYTELNFIDHDFGHRRDLLLHAVEDIVEALETGRSPACTAEDGLAALRIGLAGHESARTGDRIAVRRPAIA